MHPETMQTTPGREGNSPDTARFVLGLLPAPFNFFYLVLILAPGRIAYPSGLRREGLLRFRTYLLGVLPVIGWLRIW